MGAILRLARIDPATESHWRAGDIEQEHNHGSRYLCMLFVQTAVVIMLRQ
ncbi:MAG: hypothetical protein R8G34_10850 [Paracoccaceae bacterium]|nr:hypothetical protein [Paracoccaceae bacterium]